MGFGDKCCVGGSNNDRRYPKEWVIHSHVEKLSFHKPKQSLIEAWSRQVQKGRKDFSIGKSRESVESTDKVGISFTKLVLPYIIRVKFFL